MDLSNYIQGLSNIELYPRARDDWLVRFIQFTPDFVVNPTIHSEAELLILRNHPDELRLSLALTFDILYSTFHPVSTSTLSQSTPGGLGSKSFSDDQTLPSAIGADRTGPQSRVWTLKWNAKLAAEINQACSIHSFTGVFINSKSTFELESATCMLPLPCLDGDLPWSISLSTAFHSAISPGGIQFIQQQRGGGSGLAESTWHVDHRMSVVGAAPSTHVREDVQGNGEDDGQSRRGDFSGGGGDGTRGAAREQNRTAIKAAEGDDAYGRT
ncbi:hypothetical protein B0H13DRAFT_1877448 [Mycena leptocephala]|nr:hypothetical protein B0H13DRAFT_1877448 [Mycena leptocephala]